MATSSAGTGTGIFKGSEFSGKLDQDAFFYSKLFHKIDENKSEVMPVIAQRLASIQSLMIKFPIEKAKELTNIQNITSLKEALQIAVELEMTVLFEYLYACFSVINSSDEVYNEPGTLKDMSPYFSELRREYKNQFMIICIQEMQHMCMAIDMLISVGGIPDLQKVNFPSEIGVSGEKSDLIRLNLESLFMFAKNEEPYPDDSNTKADIVPAIPLTPAADIDGSGFQYYSIAQLYNAITDGFNYIHAQIGDSMFQIDPRMTHMSNKNKYKSLHKVLHDIDIIQTQGEGAKGGVLFTTIIKQILEWISDLVLQDGSQESQLQKTIIALCNSILAELDDLTKLLPNIMELIKLLEEFREIDGVKLPFDTSIFITLKDIQPSHWGRFLMMITNYMMMMSETKEIEKENQISANFSRPSYPRPDAGGYHPITQVIVDLTNTSFHVLLKILEGTIIQVPNEMEATHKISERYNNIRFYPIMSILIYPLGELLSYFQLNKVGVDKTAGFPFIPNTDEPPISTPLEKYLDVVLTLKNLYDQSLKLNQAFFDSLKECVGTWIKDPDTQKIIVDRISYMLQKVIMSIRVLYLGFSNTSSPQNMRSNPAPPKSIKDKFYLNVEYDGYVIYSMATDNDPTFDTRGFCGHQFMFEYNKDPDFRDEFYTQNTLKQGDKPFTRDFIPENFYKGVKVTSANLVAPSYLTAEELRKLHFEELQLAVRDDFMKNPTDFRFDSMTLNGVEYYPKFSQLNYALTRYIGMDPINVGFDTPSFTLSRANLIYDDNNNVVDYETACLTCSQNFGKYPNMANDRMPKSGGYLDWAHPFLANNGLLSNTNRINSRTGSGQCLPDILMKYEKRAEAILKEINPIIQNYPNDPLVQLIPTFLQYYPQSKLICIALMVNIPDPVVKNKLSYLCTRYLNAIELISPAIAGIAGASQCFYHVPLNGPKEEDKANHLVAINKATGPLSAIEFVKDQDWTTDFWVGGVDYDAITFFLSGSLMIPVFLNPPNP